MEDIEQILNKIDDNTESILAELEVKPIASNRSRKGIRDVVENISDSLNEIKEHTERIRDYSEVWLVLIWISRFVLFTNIVLAIIIAIAIFHFW